MNNELYNLSGCKDKTAYEAIKNVRREERRKLIEELNAVYGSQRKINGNQITSERCNANAVRHKNNRSNVCFVA